MIGTDAFQEADVVGASMPITKHSFLVTNPQDIPARLAEAFYLAATGRPGPVLVDITKSAQVSQMDFSWPPALDLPGYKVADRPNMKQVRAAARAIVEAQAPCCTSAVVSSEAARLRHSLPSLRPLMRPL